MVSFWLPWFTPGSVLKAALGLAGCLVSWLHLGSPGLPASAALFPLLGLASSLQPWRRHVENQPAQLVLSPFPPWPAWPLQWSSSCACYGGIPGGNKGGYPEGITSKDCFSRSAVCPRGPGLEAESYEVDGWSYSRHP